MKPLRLLFIGLASFAVLVLIVIALAFTPGVQTWAAHKFAPATPELTVAIGRVDAGINKTRIDNIRVIQPGLVLTIPSAEIEVNVVDAVGGKVEVRRLVAKGWVLDLIPRSGSVVRPTASDPAESAKSAFDGIFKLIELPVDLAVDGVDLSGEVFLPEGRAQVSITGGGIASGKDGKFTLTSDLKTGASSVSVNAVLGARMNSPRTFDRFTIDAAATATDPQLPAGAKMNFALSAARDGAVENYKADVRSGMRELVAVEIKLAEGAAPVVGSWKLDVVSADVAPFSLGKPLPEFVVKGSGTLGSNRAFTLVNAKGMITASVDKLDAIQPEFSAFGPLNFELTFDAAKDGEVVRLSGFDVRVSNPKPVFSASAASSLELNTTTGVLKTGDQSAAWLRVKLDAIPLTWSRPFLGDLAITGEPVRGEFSADITSDGGFKLRPVTPITLVNFSASKAGKPIVSGLNISLATEADYTPKGWTAQVTDLTVLSAAAPLLKFTARASQETERTDQPLKAEGAYEINLPVALTQPVAAGSVALKRGLARGDFSASIAKLQSATFTLQLADLVAANDVSSALPSVALQARADINAAGRIDATVPIVITQAGRRSDLTLGAVITPAEKNTDIKAQLTGDTLNVADLMLFSSVSPSPAQATAPAAPVPAPTKPVTPPAAPAPTAPLWDGVTGELKIAFKKIIYTGDIQVTGVEGMIKITPAALTLENIGAALKTGGTFKAGGDLQFDAKQKQPYALKADVALTDVEPAPILRALSPGKPSPVEGKFNLTTQLAGRAIEPAGFTESVVGDIKLSSRQGTLKAISVKAGANAENAGRVAAVAGLFGALAGSDSTVKYADRVRAAADVTKQFTSIQFDQLELVVGRDEKNNLGIKTLSVISPLIHLTGSGEITYQPGVPLMQQPLLVNLQVGAKDKLAADLRTLKLIEGQPDKLGYSPLVEELKLDGSLQAIGTSQLQRLLDRAMAN
ncbi:AsmA family protein [Rariglobus hedericola]|uniref:AsmA family protein n=1 Tax=Rariglobus hedericola TaxID=2597822 RepID=A0A556QQ98_9BACT|nr:AsmA family protein [Rariglobus hedericola]TSJ78793.1 AsmA family protein [Rariglobus hedericola]